MVNVTWSPPDAYWRYEADPATGLNSSPPTVPGKAGHDRRDRAQLRWAEAGRGQAGG